MLAVLGLVFWRSATNLQGHVQAGSQMIVEALLANRNYTPIDMAAIRAGYVSISPLGKDTTSQADLDPLARLLAPK
mgnify:CR=1 FL=1